MQNPGWAVVADGAPSRKVDACLYVVRGFRAVECGTCFHQCEEIAVGTMG